MISIKLSRIIIVRVPNDNHPESFDLCLYAYDAQRAWYLCALIRGISKNSLLYKKKKKKESKFETISLDVRMYIRIRNSSLVHLFAIVARVHFPFSSLDVKAIFNVVIIATRQIHYIVEKCNPNTKWWSRIILL